MQATTACNAPPDSSLQTRTFWRIDKENWQINNFSEAGFTASAQLLIL